MMDAPTPPPVSSKDGSGKTWESRYGEVVWAKFGSFPWWPSCILDPHKILERDQCKPQAINSIGKTYTVYFYGDGTLGFATPSNIKIFNEENQNKFRNQKLPKSYLKIFPEAVLAAEEEAAKEKNERLAWYKELDEVKVEVEEEENGESDDKEEEEEEGEDKNEKEDRPDRAVKTPESSKEKEELVSPSKRKRGRPPSQGKESKPNKKSKKTASTKKKSLESDVEITKDEEEEKVVSEEDLYFQSESEAEFDYSDDEESRGGGRRKGSFGGDKKRLSKSTKTKLISAADVPSSNKKKGRPPKSESKESSTPTAVAINKRETTGSTTKVKSQFEDESRNERFNRLYEILKLTTEKDTFDEARALKTLEKLKGMNLSIHEVRDSGIGKFINVLTKTHFSSVIKDSANAMLTIWKNLMSSGVLLTKPKTPTGAKSEPTIQRTASDPIEDGHHSETVKSNKLNRIEDLISEEVKKQVERYRAILLFDSIFQDHHLSIDFEKAIYDTFQSSGTLPSIYFESTTRFYAFLKSSSSSEAKEYIRIRLQEQQNGSEGNNGSSSSSSSRSTHPFILQQFSYIATS